MSKYENYIKRICTDEGNWSYKAVLGLIILVSA